MHPPLKYKAGNCTFDTNASFGADFGRGRNPLRRDERHVVRQYEMTVPHFVLTLSQTLELGSLRKIT